MDVEVHHGLTGGFSHVHADIVAVGVELFVEKGLSLPDEGEESGEFCVGRVEEARDVAEGDDEEVAGVYREFIIAGVAEVVCEDDLVFGWVAEGADQSAHASYPRVWMR